MQINVYAMKRVRADQPPNIINLCLSIDEIPIPSENNCKAIDGSDLQIASIRLENQT